MLLLPLITNSQEFRLEVVLEQSKGKEIYLANHYLGSIYAKDTIILDNEGRGVFTADSLLPQGLYKIFADENHHFDFLLGADQQFLLKNQSFLPETVEVEGSDESKAFADYMRFFSDLQKKNAAIREKTESADQSEKAELIDELNDLTAELYACWKKTENEFPGSFLPKFLKANHVPVPDISKLPGNVQNNDSLLFLHRFYFQQKHFWDNFDYTDERFLYTPFYKNKLDTWFTKVLYQNYDSVKVPVFNFIEEVRHSKRIFQFVVSHFLNSSIKSNIMGMDALFVDLAKEYYLTGEAFWATDESLEKIKENVLFFENNLIGKIAPDLSLEGFDGEYHHLHQTNAKFTLVLLYEPGCSHCKQFVPELYRDIYLPFRDNGLEVFAIYTMSDKSEWSRFLEEHQLYEWINVWDENHISRFKILYDGRSTPGIYILDRNKKIVAKKLNIGQIKDFLKHELL